MKKVLIINGHPDELSFNAALRDAYIAGASTNNVSLEVLNLSELEFDPNLRYGYRKRSDWFTGHTQGFYRSHISTWSHVQECRRQSIPRRIIER